MVIMMDQRATKDDQQLEKTQRIVFVTVGTTKFEALVRTVDTDACLHALRARGFTDVVMQIGHGEYTPRVNEQSAEKTGVNVTFYRHDPQYKRDVRRADLIISHAGAGSVMDALSAKKHLVVVVNDKLMDNHQTELADAMAEQNYCVSTTCAQLVATLESANFDGLLSYPEPNEEAFPALVDQVMGVTIDDKITKQE